MKRLIITLLICALAAGGQALAQSQPRADAAQARAEQRDQRQQQLEAFRDRLIALAEEFDLTTAQKIQLTTILQAAVPEAAAVAADMADNRDRLADVLAAEPLDVAAVEAIADAQGALFTELARIRSGAFVDMRSVLTEEQLGLLVEVRAAIADQAAQFAAGRESRSARRAERRAALRGRIPGDRLAALAEEFGLTPAQRAEIRSMLEAAVPSVLDVAADMAANRQAIADAIRAEPVDTAAIDALTGQQGELFAELVLVRADAVVRIRGVLTDDQLAMLDELRAALRARLARVAGAL